MKDRIKWFVAAAAVAAAFVIGRVSAEDAPKPAGTDATADMKKMEGRWDVAMKWFMDPTGAPVEPGTPPMTGKGEAVFSPVLGGSFMRQEFKSLDEGGAFEGLGYLGCDPSDQKITSIWMDSMSPVISVSTGVRDDKGVVAVSGKGKGMKGEEVTMTYITTWTGADSFTFDLMSESGGKKMPVGSLAYTRRK